MKINEVEQLAGIPKKNIRFYEKEGLLSPRRNSENGYRDYSDIDVSRLRQIKLLRKLAVPIVEIRQMLSGSLTMADALRRHLILLEREEKNIKQIQLFCSRLLDRETALDTLDAESYLREMEQMEQEGVSFMNIGKQDRKKKYIAPIVVTALVLGLLGWLLGIILWGFSVEHAPIFVVALVALIPIAVGVGAVLALIQRIKEIQGGEEDAAGKY
ncbi:MULTISPECIES: MerR family transcriptional regulator [Anaerotruncus]|uniref:MerR family transcriptional regulator n=1 Tax=Anaerotruncus TaxID=244127 RepID=UPI00082CC5BD|nr:MULTISPECIES: MerR family transcriptional regulator [Anaerotruncus]RGX54207.1 MerR family transcriptional regulator [Anaerotruncus sp. AF02-27]